jgi:acetyltransferase-like isoleucine patch superfamily enzyme
MKDTQKSSPNSEKHLFFSEWLRKRESLVINLVEWVPAKLGIKLRNLLYRWMFERFGTSVQIQPSVEFVNVDGIEIGNGVHIDRYVRLRNVDRSSKICIGDGVRLNRGIDIKLHSGGQGKFEIGENTSIGPYSCLSGQHIKIGKGCLIAAHAGIFATNHVYADLTQEIRTQGFTYKGIVIEDDCWLGTGVKVLDGVTIGRGSVIGAGAVVTKDIPPYSIAVGVPAKVVSRRNATPRNSVEAEMLSTVEAEMLSTTALLSRELLIGAC